MRVGSGRICVWEKDGGKRTGGEDGGEDLRREGVVRRALLRGRQEDRHAVELAQQRAHLALVLRRHRSLRQPDDDDIDVQRAEAVTASLRGSSEE